jgi:uncharacterized protein YbbK (DUF523 family)
MSQSRFGKAEFNARLKRGYNHYMYLVSACLAGFRTRYDGEDALDERVKALLASGKAVAVCPEQLAGLSTPRPPVEFASGDGGSLLDGEGRILDPMGANISGVFVRGAREALRIARLYGITKAILKDGSPSCGVTYIYSGGSRRAGRGVCAELLERNNIGVMTVDSL